MGIYRVGLINMPYAGIQLPSLALTQLKEVTKKKAAGRVDTQVLYLNHDFAVWLGLDLYNTIANSLQSTVCGLGDWFFRELAFPQSPDNTVAYTNRFLWRFEESEVLAGQLAVKRRNLATFLDSLIDQYGLASFDLIGFTSMFSQNLASFAMAARLKNRNPHLVTVAGGANCETVMGEVIARNITAIDYVFSGSALLTFPELVQAMLGGERQKCDNIVGVLSKNKIRGLLSGQFNELGAELDINAEIKLDYDDFLASITAKCPTEMDKAGLLFETSRGCWWGEHSQCRFCGLNGSKMAYRFMAPKRALQQFTELFRYGPRISRFKAVDNIAPKSYFSNVFPKLQAPANATLFYEIKTNLDDEQIRVLADAGIREIQPGIESLATSTLKLMRKGTTAFQNINFLKSCRRHAIKPEWNLLVGFPGEEEAVFAEYDAALPLLFHLPPPIGVFPIRFDRFSPYFQTADDFGLDLKPYDFYNFVYPFSKSDIARLAYFFMDHNAAAPHMKLTAKWLKKIEAHIQRWRRLWDRATMNGPIRLTYEWAGQSRLVHDSRSGKVIEHDIDELGLEVLDALASPMNIDGLSKIIAGVPAVELAAQIDILQKQGLLFQEKNRFLSLVVNTAMETGYL